MDGDAGVFEHGSKNQRVSRPVVAASGSGPPRWALR
jgi:hypothetical protein